MELESWRRSLRETWLPCLSDRELSALTDALACDDARLAQILVVRPVPVGEYATANAVQASAIAAAVWLPHGPMRAADVEALWLARRDEARQRGLRTGACALDFASWWVLADWSIARAGTLAECQRELARRQGEPDDLDELERVLPRVRIAE